MTLDIDSKDSLGDRMKLHESEFEKTVPRERYIVLRVDGRAFSTYTEGYDKPFDTRIEDAMNAAAIALRDEFSANMVYTQSDEISVFIAPKWNEKAGVFNDHVFNGRVQKIVGIAASTAAIAFDRNLKDKRAPTFDCRVMSLDLSEAANALYWRVLDNERNATSALYRYTLGHAAMQNKPCSVMRSELADLWTNLDPNRKHGRFIKRVLTATENEDRPYRSSTCVIVPSWINGVRPVHKELQQLIASKRILGEFPVWAYTEETADAN